MGCAVLLPLLALSASPVLLPQFEDSAAITDLSQPVSVRFAPTGEIFVAEKAGRVKRFGAMPNPGAGTVVLDIRAEVASNSDRGLLGIALHPEYPISPYVYLLYTYDAPPGQSAPYWNDSCGGADQPHPHDAGAGCPVTARLVRYTFAEGTLKDPLLLIDQQWYQQYLSHSIGDLAFGPDGQLYVSAGEGASYRFSDTGTVGQRSSLFPFADDAVNEGGALRAQDLLSPGDPVGLSGAILRLDPETGEASAGNPLSGDAARIIAFGLRNPFRIGFRPGTAELWITDVGWNNWEELNRISNVADDVVENFGWPCYEGKAPFSNFASAPSCAKLIANTLPPTTPGQLTPPYFAYRHENAPGSQDATPCKGGGNSVAGVAFYGGGAYPAEYAGALFFADYAVGCIYAMRTNASTGIPDPARLVVLEHAAYAPVGLSIGPEGDLYYASVVRGEIRHIRFVGAAPSVSARADVLHGPAPLAVQFDGSASIDPDGAPLTFAWDLDGDGSYDDASDAAPSFVYAAEGTYRARLHVVDVSGQDAYSEELVIRVGSSPPAPVIRAPEAGLAWASDDIISFSGFADDAEEGPLAESQLRWVVTLFHCPVEDCHAHPLLELEGVGGGSFAAVPDGYPSRFEITLSAIDASGLSASTSVRIDPRPTAIVIDSSPPGLALAYGGETITTPLHRTEVEHFPLDLTAPAEQAGQIFDHWSDGVTELTRSWRAPATEGTLVAYYRSPAPLDQPPEPKPLAGPEEPAVEALEEPPALSSAASSSRRGCTQTSAGCTGLWMLLLLYAARASQRSKASKA